MNNNCNPQISLVTLVFPTFLSKEKGREQGVLKTKTCTKLGKF